MKRLNLIVLLVGLSAGFDGHAETAPAMRFHASSPMEAQAWQRTAREKLFALMMGGSEPARGPLAPQVIRRIEVPAGGYVLEELTLQTLPDRRAHVWLARPSQPKGKVGGVLAINGHGGSGEEIVRGTGLYWYGRALAEMGYVVIAPDVGQHTLQHTNWSLMGERTWDALRCVDYLVTLPEVDAGRLAVAGLSLGGETTMYVAALDERLKIACSSGWLTTVANMKNGHCPCFNFPGLEENFDFADIFACVAPRSLVCELGEQERAPGGFPVSIGRQALEAIRPAYRVFNAESNLTLTVHPGPHVFSGRDFFPKLRSALGANHPPLPNDVATAAWVRFTDGPESLDGTAYHWLGRTELKVAFDVAPRPGDALELGWGAKGDEREAVFQINGQSMTVRDGGHWGFRWIRVPIPTSVKGERYEIETRRGKPQFAFLSEVRLISSSAGENRPDLRVPSHKGRVTLAPVQSLAPVEAFPEMRRVWDRATPLPPDLAKDERIAALFRLAELHSRQANEAFYRCRRFVDGWLAMADPKTGLIPENLGRGRDHWNGRNNAADNYAFMVLTCALTDRPLFEGRMRAMLKTETELTRRLDRLGDYYQFSKGGFEFDTVDFDRLAFDNAEYVKDGLIPLTEWLGPSPWSERAVGLIEDIWKNAAIETPFGKIPTLNFEVNGDLLQSNSRLYWFTGQRKYLDWAIRLGDYYLLGTNHPTRDRTELRLMDHGGEVVNGLTELYVILSRTDPAKKRTYEKPLREIFESILRHGRNADGMLYSTYNPQTGKNSGQFADTWGYIYDGVYTMSLVDDLPAYREAIAHALRNLKGKYEGVPWADKSTMDATADSVESALNLIHRIPVASAAEWCDSQIRLMWSVQRPDGVIEGWHGDGNFARTSIMYALWKTQGLTVQPWRRDVRLGAVREGGRLHVFLTAAEPWTGRVIFDRPRHRESLHLPMDYPRINQFPEWFPVTDGDQLLWREKPGAKETAIAGRVLRDGLSVQLKAGEHLLWTFALAGAAAH